MDERVQQAKRAWQGQQDDYVQALVYVTRLIQSGKNVADDLAALLSGRPLDLRHLLMNHHAESFGFWGMVDGIGFKVTVTRCWTDHEGWAILKHYGELPVLDDGSMGPNPPHPTLVLVERDDNGLHCWRQHDLVPDNESESDYEDVYDAIRDAVNIADGRLVPYEPSDRLCVFCERPGSMSHPLVPFNEAGHPEQAHESCIKQLHEIDPEGRR